MKKTILPMIIPLALLCVMVSPDAGALTPPPDGGYPNYTTAEGTNALKNLTTGAGNTGIGWYSLFANGSGSFNTGLGAGALALNNGDSNTATGAAALLLNTSGMQNTAVGTDAMVYNETGNDNTAVGAFALFNNIAGFANSAFGVQALRNNTGFNNTAIGASALVSNTNGVQNTAIGVNALLLNNGTNNTAVGLGAGENATTGSGNVYIGAFTPGVAGESNTTHIRNVYDSIASSRAVYVNSDNKIGTLSSSRRYKEEIKPMDKASETLFALNPVTFRYKKPIDPSQALSFGLIAEEVGKVNPALITRDKQGKPQTVRYEAVNAMLLNEFLKEHRKVEALERQQKSFESKFAEQAKQIEALRSDLQKVSARFEVRTATPQIAAKTP